MTEWLAQRTEPYRLICHPGLVVKREEATPPSSIALLIGAEGGFTDDEVSEAMANQFQPFALGPRILRTETAAVAALTKLQVSWGDI